MISVTNIYMIRHILVALTMISVVLAVIIFLTQSLRYLELVIESGAAGSTFWMITLLALPRFFEVILPIGLAGAIIFIYHRMVTDRELTIMRASGFSPFKIARPALFVAAGLTLILWFITLWLAPVSLRTVQQKQHLLKSEVSNLMFQEGIFNRFGKDITVFIKNRASNGELRGLMIHDRRKQNKHPVTVTAQRGIILATDEGFQVRVFDGSRQDYDPKTHTLNRLDFQRYNIDLPIAGSSSSRWREPNERTFWELLHPDPDNARDMENLVEFRIEAHRQIISPLLCLAVTFSVLPFLLIGPYLRQGISHRIAIAVGAVIALHAVYLSAFNLARQYEIAGLIAMYVVVLLPIFIGGFIISPFAEKWRHQSLYFKRKESLS